MNNCKHKPFFDREYLFHRYDGVGFRCRKCGKKIKLEKSNKSLKVRTLVFVICLTVQTLLVRFIVSMNISTVFKCIFISLWTLLVFGILSLTENKTERWIENSEDEDDHWNGI